MSEVEKPVSGTPVEGSSTTPQGPDSGQTPTINSDGPKTVSWEVHQKLMSERDTYRSDMHKQKERSKELEAKVGDIESSQLKAKGDHEAFGARETERADKAEAEVEKLGSYVTRTQKFQEVRALALKAGLRGEAEIDLEHLDFKDVLVEATSSGRYLVSGAEQYVEQLKASRPHWFTDSTPPNVNGGRGGAIPPTAHAMSLTDLAQLEKDFSGGRITKDVLVEGHKRYTKQERENLAKT